MTVTRNATGVVLEDYARERELGRRLLQMLFQPLFYNTSDFLRERVLVECFIALARGGVRVGSDPELARAVAQPVVFCFSPHADGDDGQWRQVYAGGEALAGDADLSRFIL